MKTSSKILVAAVMIFMSAGIGAQSISKNKILTNKFNPWRVVVNYDADHSRDNYYLLSVNNEEYGKKRDGSYFQTYSFFWNSGGVDRVYRGGKNRPYAGKRRDVYVWVQNRQGGRLPGYKKHYSLRFENVGRQVRACGI